MTTGNLETSPHASPLTPCSNNPCTNGGTCLPNSNGFMCSCAFGFKGNTVLIFMS